MENNPQNPVTIERLLRLKRYEAPTPESWEVFERELEKRRLRALCEKPRGARTLVWMVRLAGYTPLATALAVMALFHTGVVSWPATEEPASTARVIAVQSAREAPQRGPSAESAPARNEGPRVMASIDRGRDSLEELSAQTAFAMETIHATDASSGVRPGYQRQFVLSSFDASDNSGREFAPEETLRASPRDRLSGSRFVY